MSGYREQNASHCQTRAMVMQSQNKIPSDCYSKWKFRNANPPLLVPWQSLQAHVMQGWKHQIASQSQV